jgi:hypothetical protein
MLEAMSDGQRALVDSLIDAPTAWQTPMQLALRTGLPLLKTADELADLYAAGVVVPWPACPEGVAVTLTPWAAERLEVRIVEIGVKEVPRWARAGQPEPPPPRAFPERLPRR